MATRRYRQGLYRYSPKRAQAARAKGKTGPRPDSKAGRRAARQAAAKGRLPKPGTAAEAPAQTELDLGEASQAAHPGPIDLADPWTWPEQLVDARNAHLRALLFGPAADIEPARRAWIEELNRWGF